MFARMHPSQRAPAGKAALPRALLAAGALALAGCQTAAGAPVATTDRAAAFTPANWTATCANHDDWDLAAPPFRIHGDTYYVGTCGISAILVAGDEGHVLIDGATQAGGPIIAENVARLGFDMADVKLLLLTHEHHDHAGGLAYLQQASGARLLASPAAATALASGSAAPDDPQASVLDPFPQATVAGTLADGELVRLGATAITAIATPGHTAGAMSWTWRACDGADCKQIVYLDSLSAVSAEGYRFTDHPALTATFRASYDKVAALPCDIALTPHPTSSAMPQRIASPGGLVDPAGCRSYAQTMRERLDARLATEAAGSGPAG